MHSQINWTDRETITKYDNIGKVDFGRGQEHEGNGNK